MAPGGSFIQAFFQHEPLTIDYFGGRFCADGQDLRDVAEDRLFFKTIENFAFVDHVIVIFDHSPLRLFISFIQSEKNLILVSGIDLTIGRNSLYFSHRRTYYIT